MVKTDNRIYWLDNLRTFMIFLVVVIHAATIFEKYSMGALWWIVIDPSNSDLNGILFLILNIFVMATIFFVSGYLVPLTLKSKSGWKFLRSKFQRIMIPWIIAVLILIPLYKVIFLYSRGLPQESWTAYFHWKSLWSQNWLWFLPVLFLFDMIYLLFDKINTSKISVKQSIWITLIVVFVYSFSMDYFGLHGWTKTILIDFQNERLLVYFMIFILGSQLYKIKAFDSSKVNKKINTIVHSTGWLPINLYVFFVIYTLIYPENYIINKVIHVSLARLSFTLSLAYLLYVFVTVFWYYMNKTGKILNTLNKNSYGVYIIHVIVMGVIAVIMLNAGIPLFLKFIILITSTYLICNLLVYFYRSYIKAMFTK
ncbi:acyltransferase family protein [Candidatus Neomarinimicrobiota bacterium]